MGDDSSGLKRLLATLADEFGLPASGRPELRFQPKIDLRRKCIADVEAFAPEPVANPDAAQQTLTALFEDWTALDRAGFNLRLAIHMPLGALNAQPMVALAQKWTAAAEHWPGIAIGIAEDEIVRDLKGIQALADELGRCGIVIGIDNFGAGFSSPASLREFGFAELKINGSFVQGCAENKTNAAICQTAIELAHQFRAVAVAEGVDRGADLSALQLMGCDVVQGALLAPVLPLDGFITLLNRHVGQGRPHAPEVRKSA